jgi:hypothetical protein
MIQAKKVFHSRSLAKPVPLPRHCAQCGTKLTATQTRKGVQCCDMVCRKEYDEKLKRARRPQEVHCSYCEKPLDPLSRQPYQWKASDVHYCDMVCADAHRRATGAYAVMSAQGNQVMAAYKEKHGHVQGYEDRAAAVAKNNKVAPPKAKHFQRAGKVWGYDVNFFPNEDDDGYRASVPELPELGIVHCKTKKEGLRLIRAMIAHERGE